MAREMSEEQKAAIAKAREASKERRSQVLNVGQWQIFRADEDNWVLRKGEDGENRYFPTKVWALKSLLHEEIGSRHATSIRELLAVVAKAEAEIARAATA